MIFMGYNKNMNKILLHIPHSSKVIPDCFWNNTCQSGEIINKFVNDITDIDTDILFSNNKYEKIVFPYSRIFCDVEKFDNDKLEPMSKFGMGVIYSKTNYGLCFRNYDKDYCDMVLTKYYHPYHKALNYKVENLLKENDHVVLVDCHSFSKNIIMIKENQKNLPEICIGFNGTKDKLSKYCIQFFKNLGYKVKSNYPYSGTIIPSRFINKQNPKLKSVMVEINKELYKKNSTSFYKLQQDINDLLKMIESLNFN